MLNLYEIVGVEDSELEGTVFGHFTSEELAEAALKEMPEEFKEEVEIRRSNIALNTLEIDGNVVNFTESKTAKEVLASRDEYNNVKGYVTVHISDITDNDYEGFLDCISAKLVGSDLLMNIDYDVVSIDKDDNIVLLVFGDASSVLEMEDDYEKE